MPGTIALPAVIPTVRTPSPPSSASRILTPSPAPIQPPGIGAAEAFGAVGVTVGQLASPTGIAATAPAFGRPRILRVGQSIVPAGIASTVAYGSSTVGFGGVVQFLRPPGLTGAQAFGAAAFTSSSSTIISPVGIPG